MLTVGLLVRLHARPGKEAEIEDFLRDGLSVVEDEVETPTWFAVRINCATFGIFDAFTEDTGRQAHLSGRIAAALMERSDELFARPPTIERVEVLAHKLPA
ncbi:putative quinol monooxygenase [Sphaerisporangium perillae]|uniref:putative quinol monooxygenase n=1 Tax=Sphaerisporangium perillae TaxID=2935860 RepID=UPI00200D2B07|nr:antibiotic biosynthesis monooxygenase [Sphaerisporangium perillae]